MVRRKKGYVVNAITAAVRDASAKRTFVKRGYRRERPERCKHAAETVARKRREQLSDAMKSARWSVVDLLETHALILRSRADSFKSPKAFEALVREHCNGDRPSC